MADTAKIVVITGVAIAVFGLLMMALDKSGSWGWLNWFGNLPLDIKMNRKNFQLYFPLGTSLLLSLLLTLVIYLFNKFIR